MCGYVCPVCEGEGYEVGTTRECAYCRMPSDTVAEPEEISAQEWMNSTHHSCPCEGK